MLRDRARAAGLDAVLVTRLVNVRYLTGFTGSNGALLRHRGRCRRARAPTAATPPRPARQAPDVELLVERASAPALPRRRAEGAGGWASSRTTSPSTCTPALADRAAGAELVSIRHAVEALRAVKDDGEIALLRQACAIADQALAELLAAGGLRAGRTEREVGRDLDDRMLELGADGPSFETIVAAGPNRAIPHHRPTDRVLRRGDLVKLDFGATVGGYHSDMTRTAGRWASRPDWQREIYDAGRAPRSGPAGRRWPPARTCATVDAAARDVVAAAGHGERVRARARATASAWRSTRRRCSASSAPGRLAAGMAVTVEPGVYLPGRGGVRIEDTLVVARRRRARAADHSPPRTCWSSDRPDP